jgi:hypothetical protein
MGQHTLEYAKNVVVAIYVETLNTRMGKWKFAKVKPPITYNIRNKEYTITKDSKTHKIKRDKKNWKMKIKKELLKEIEKLS